MVTAQRLQSLTYKPRRRMHKSEITTDSVESATPSCNCYESGSTTQGLDRSPETARV